MAPTRTMLPECDEGRTSFHGNPSWPSTDPVRLEPFLQLPCAADLDPTPRKWYLRHIAPRPTTTTTKRRRFKIRCNRLGLHCTVLFDGYFEQRVLSTGRPTTILQEPSAVPQTRFPSKKSEPRYNQIPNTIKTQTPQKEPKRYSRNNM